MVERKVCIVTGTRAEYGLLYWLMKQVRDDEKLILQTVVTGMHLSPEFGLTAQTIEDDGFEIDANIEMLLSSDTSVGVAKSIGLGVLGFAETLTRLRPDILVVLGDRYEILAAAQVALVLRIPIAHIGGGDSTEGAFDEAIRHSVSKMSQLHFVTNDLAKKRLQQLGENPASIYNVGSLGLDFLGEMQLLKKEDLEEELHFRFKERNALITFHAATLDETGPDLQFFELLSALETLGPDFGLIFTKPNSDTGGRQLIKMLEAFVERHPNACLHASLGQKKYLSSVALVDVVIGNSSSGLYEVPSFCTPTVNIGDRQKGRIKAHSVVDCDPIKEDICQAITSALAMDCSTVINPYGSGGTALKICRVLKEIPDLQGLLKKHFYEV